MDSKLVRRANIAIRKTRPYFPPKRICEKFYSEGLLEICFLSTRCSRDLQGSCMMCDYGATQNDCTDTAYIQEMDRMLQNTEDPVDILLLCTNGSFLDSCQISDELFRAILEQTGKYEIPTVEVETHYLDVTREKLELMKRFLPGKNIVIEMGLETIRPEYQEKVVMKEINLEAYEDVISLVKSFGFSVDNNVMVGLPFLSPKEQFEDVLETIRWSITRGGHSVLFPVNIKPYTLLMQAYHAGLYRPISQWMIPLILDALPEKWLETITVVWYGGREEDYGTNSGRATFPHACGDCADAVLKFYKEFSTAAGGANRKKLLRQLLTGTDCQCLDQTRRSIMQTSENTFEDRYAAFLTWLETQNF